MASALLYLLQWLSIETACRKFSLTSVLVIGALSGKLSSLVSRTKTCKKVVG